MTATARRFTLGVYCDATALGGAEVNLSRVLAWLPEQIQVSIVGVDDEVVDWLRGHRPGSRALTLPPISDRSDLSGLRVHRSTFRRLQVDLLQFNLSSASSCQWAMFAATAIRGPKRIAVENSPMGVWSSTSAKLKRFNSAHLAAHIAVGQRTARMVEESSGLPEGSIATIYHGVPDVGRESISRGEEPTLVTVARHDPVKGIDVLLNAFAKVSPPARLVLIGEGSETESLNEQCQELSITERVEFRPLPWDQRAADLMWAYDGLILPSRLEGFPVTIVEAMLAGIPVVATDVGSVSEAVIPGETGWIVPPEDPSALADAIRELLSDSQRAKAMGARARLIAEERFTMEATILAYLDLFERVLGGRARTKHSMIR